MPRPMKSSSTMREAANKLVASDLPLYMACPCRSILIDLCTLHFSFFVINDSQVKVLFRLTKPPVAQLTRIHVVTPKAPVWVTLNPQVNSSTFHLHWSQILKLKVQPSPGGPVFITGWEAPHRLAINSYWVLRLPYVYWGEGG